MAELDAPKMAYVVINSLGQACFSAGSFERAVERVAALMRAEAEFSNGRVFWRIERVEADDGADSVVRSENKQAGVTGIDLTEESADHWENGASYPTGNVPTFGDIDPADKLPPIEEFDD